MKKFCPFLILLFFSVTCFAQQPCTDEIIMAVKGSWSKKPDANMSGNQQAQALVRIDKMQQLVRSAYPEPKGMEAGWYRSIGSYYSSVDKASNSYDLNAMFFTWYCNIHVKKLMLSTEASNGLNIWVNKFQWFADKDETFTVDRQPVYLLTKKLGELKGFPLYAGGGNSAANTGTSFSKAVLVSRSGQLPFTPVIRKQYLEIFLKNKEAAYIKMRDGLLKMPVRSDAQEEKYKQEQLEKVVNANGTNEAVREKAKANFLRGYTTAKQRKQADIDKNEKVYQQDIKAASAYLANTSSGELTKPAYMNSTSYQSSFREFAKENEGRMLVIINGHYFNNKLPAYAPQFLIVYWYWNTEKPSIDFSTHIENNFDFTALQSMLDK